FAEFKESVCQEATIPFRVELVGWHEFGIMVETFRRICPFLTEDGWCGVYEWRPRICRLAGTVFKDPVTDVFLRDFCPLAEDARRRIGFESGSFDIVGMDAGLMEFREEFQVVIRNEFGVELGSGHTFPVAGVLEAASRSFS
ncbi:hypothetical protein K8T06_03405, partial [bacterium]|nr:hypothetical protein [bacterium]